MQKNRLPSLIIVAVASIWPGSAAHADSSLNEGISHFNKREYKQAIQALDKSISANPKLPTPLYYEAMSFYQLGDT